MKELMAQPDGATEALLGQIADEFTGRLNRGEQPDIEEYAARYPELGDLLRQVLAALQVMGPGGPRRCPRPAAPGSRRRCLAAAPPGRPRVLRCS